MKLFTLNISHSSREALKGLRTGFPGLNARSAFLYRHKDLAVSNSSGSRRSLDRLHVVKLEGLDDGINAFHSRNRLRAHVSNLSMRVHRESFFLEKKFNFFVRFSFDMN